MKQSRLHFVGFTLLLVAALPWALVFVAYLILWALGCATPESDDCAIGEGWVEQMFAGLVYLYWLFLLSLPLAIAGMITIAIANFRQRKKQPGTD